jgi:LacI family transcriptional regulator
MSYADLLQFDNAMSPIVVVDSCFPDMKYDSVVINNTDSAFNATNYFIECGHKKIGYLMGTPRIQNFFYREMGFRRALHQNGLEFESKFLVNVSSTMDGVYSDIIHYLKDCPELPTAFFADNDIIALGAIKAFKEAGYNIPNDISIIGLDDMPFCEISSPRLSTIKVYKNEMGKMAVRQLLNRMKDKSSVFCNIQVNTTLVKRESVLQLNKVNALV